MAEKEFNVTLAAGWETRKGHVMTMPIDKRARADLEGAFSAMLADDLGGKLIVKKLTDEQRARHNKGDKAPTHYIEYIKASEIAKMNERRENKGDSNERF